MLFYYHYCYMSGDWVELINGDEYINAIHLTEVFELDDVVYVGF